MTEPMGPPPLRRWRYGMHPLATDLRVRSLGRVHIQLGEALRLEMASGGPGEDDGTVHLQYYIATELGPWALWLSCPPEEVADADATLRDLAPPLTQD
jgi:hypothetical protein